MSNNGEVGRIQIPPMKEFVVIRKDEHGGNALVKCHSLGLGRADALICYALSGSLDPVSGEPLLEQRVVRVFRKYIDVEELEFTTASTVKH